MEFARPNKKDWLPDKDLVERYRNSHDTKYIGELFQRYKNLIALLCLKYLKNKNDAEDAAMDLFEVLVVDLKKHDVKNFKAWLFTVVRNLCFKKLRTKSDVTLNEDLLKSEADVMEFDAGPDQYEVKEEQLNRMHSSIEQLPEAQATCIKLFYLEKFSYKEVSDKTGFDLKEVKSFLQNGRRNLKNMMTS